MFNVKNVITANIICTDIVVVVLTILEIGIYIAVLKEGNIIEAVNINTDFLMFFLLIENIKSTTTHIKYVIHL